jgi:hypothetical protein
VSKVYISELDICNAVASTFLGVGGLVVQGPGELTDVISELPLLQVYWTSFSEAPFQLASGGKVVSSVETINMDLYAKERAETAEDIRAAIFWMSKVRNHYNNLSAPWFGLEAIKAKDWEGRRTYLNYGPEEFSGGKFTLRMRIF